MRLYSVKTLGRVIEYLSERDAEEDLLERLYEYYKVETRIFSDELRKFFRTFL